ncbi:MAG: hypothetical protein M3Y87_28890 [Myxococcota bacterium]|nr:hypothetical protein [Myxococcota bacterium]
MTIRAEDVWEMGPAEWRALLRDGHPIEPAALEGWVYRGTSLGMPALVDRLAWKTFQKAFHRDPGAALLRGWNVRLVQQPDLSAKSEPMRDRQGTPRTFGHFGVLDARERGVPHGFDRGLLLDYSISGRSIGALDPASRLRDPIVALASGSAELLLGWSYLAIGSRTVDTPSFFTLEREHAIDHVPMR